MIIYSSVTHNIAIKAEPARHIKLGFLLYHKSSYENIKGANLSHFLSGKLNNYLAELNEQAEDMFFRLVKELAEIEGITETLKAEKQMLWVQRIILFRIFDFRLILRK